MDVPRGGGRLFLSPIARTTTSSAYRQHGSIRESSIGLTDENGRVEVFTTRDVSESAWRSGIETHLKKQPAFETYSLGAVKKRAPVDFNPPKLRRMSVLASINLNVLTHVLSPGPPSNASIAPEYNPWMMREPQKAPKICAAANPGNFFQGNPRNPARASVTTGLRCPPLIPPATSKYSERASISGGHRRDRSRSTRRRQRIRRWGDRDLQTPTMTPTPQPTLMDR